MMCIIINYNVVIYNGFSEASFCASKCLKIFIDNFTINIFIITYSYNTLQMNGLGNLEIPNPFFLLGMFVFEQEARCRVA